MEVQFERHDRSMSLHFELFGAVEQVVLPSFETPARRDELWRHTCFEFFARGEGKAYIEYNFSPSQEWAAYSFDDYRSGMSMLSHIKDSHVVRFDDEGRYLQACLFELPTGEWTHASLTAVLEAADGTKSYWALAHPPGKPDFHDPSCFTLELPPGRTTSSPRT